MKIKVNNIFTIEFLKYLFLIVSFFYTIPLTSGIITPYMKIFMLFSIIVFIYNIKNINRNKINYYLYTMIILAGLSTIVNYKNRFIQNLIIFLYLFVQVIILYSTHKDLGKEKLLDTIKKFSSIVINLTFIASIISLILVIIKFELIIEKWNTIIRIQGVYEGRIWGVYGNPNTLANLAFISLFLSIAIYRYYKYKKFLIFNCFIQLLCIFMSNSRATILATFLVILIYIFVIIVVKKEIKFTDNIIKIISVIFISVGLVSIMSLLALNSNFILKREYKEGNITNGRLDIWYASINAVKEEIIFGVGPENIKENVNKFLNPNYVIKNPDIASNTHNIFLQILLSYGILVMILFMLFNICSQVYILKYLFKKENYTKDKLKFRLILTLDMIIIGLLIMNLFDSNILFFFSFINATIFWIIYGYIISLVKKEDNRKKILFLIDNLDGGGAEKVLTDIIKNIDRSKFNVTVKTLFNEGIYINEIKGIEYKYIVSNPDIWKKRILYRIIMYLPAIILHPIIIYDNYDVEVAFLETGVTKIISGGINSKKIAWIHADIHTTKDNQKWYYSHKRFVKAYCKFNKIICVSNTSKKAFFKETGIIENVEVIYNPIDEKNIINMSKEKLDNIKSNFKVISVGRLEKIKGFDRLIKAIYNLKKENINIKLLIVGEGSQKKYLLNLVKENSLENNVEVIGFDSNPYKYIVNSDLFISSSLSEGFSLVIAEAMILGVPVLSTNTAGSQELLDGGEFGLIVGNSCNDLSEGIKKIFIDKELLSKLKEKSIERKEIFKLDKSIREIEVLIKGVCDD